MFAAIAPEAGAQGIKRILVSRARVLTDFGPGIAAMKRDAAGQYYILAKPANVIWVVSGRGQRVGQIPKPNSPGATIQYAVDFDVDPNGRILVADRGANAVDIFQPDGSLVTKLQVFAPTSVVALSNDEFAVSTLRTKRLVLIMNDRGDQIRSFGDPADAGVDVGDKPLESLGKISGDSQNNVYFAFTTLANPTIRKFDRFGYARGEASISDDQLEYTPPQHDDRVQFGFNISELNFVSMVDEGVMIGSSGDIKASGTIGTGIGGRIGGGGGPATSAGLAETLLSAGMGQSAGRGGYGGGGGRGGGGLLTGQALIEGDNVHLNFTGRGNGNAGSSSGSGDDSDESSGYKLRFNANDALAASSSSDNEWLQSAMQDFQNAEGLDQSNGYGLGPDAGGANATNGLGQGLVTGLGGMGGAFGGVGFAHPFDKPAGATTGTTAHTGAYGGGMHGGGFGGFGGFGPHGHFGEITNFVATVKVNLDPDFLVADEKPTITAVGVDPQTQEMWASVGKALLHFDKNGNLLDSYLIATPDGAALRAKAIIVEPDRLIVASDPRGIFVFERPDLSAPPSQ